MATKTLRNDPYIEIRDRLLDAMRDYLAGKRDRLPWQRPWNASLFAPQNGASGHVYNGINVVLTWLAGFSDHRWYTFNQAMQLAGYKKRGRFFTWAGKDSDKPEVNPIAKGTKGTAIVKWLFLCAECNKPFFAGKNGKCKECGKGTEKRPMLRTYTVFNHDQINWPEGKEPEFKGGLEADPAEVHKAAVAELTAFHKAEGVELKHGGTRAFCTRDGKRIQMPPKASFLSTEGYVTILAHETVHATGSPERLAREGALKARFGEDLNDKQLYAAEELVAELGAAFYCANHGLSSPTLDAEHTAYLESWITVLEKDKYAIFTATRLAKEAIERIAKPVKAKQAKRAPKAKAVALAA